VKKPVYNIQLANSKLALTFPNSFSESNVHVKKGLAITWFVVLVSPAVSLDLSRY